MNNKNYRTFALVLLTIVYGFNFIDRQIMGILAPFIQEDLNLTNTQLGCLLYTSPSPRDRQKSRMPSSA